MKLLLIFFLNVFFYGYLFFWQPQTAWQDLQKASDLCFDSVDSLIYDKRVSLSGLNRLDVEDLKEIIPSHKSVIWWLINSSEIEKKLLSNAYIQQARLSRCKGLRWGCFEIEILERKPKFLALLGGEVWTLGDDGGFIAPIKHKSVDFGIKENFKQDLKEAVLIKGLLERQYSPDILEAELARLIKVLEIVEDETKLKVQELVMQVDSDLSLKFHLYDFSVKIEFRDENLNKIKDQAQRLRKVLSATRADIKEIAEIDLAFDKLAVVRKKKLDKK